MVNTSEVSVADSRYSLASILLRLKINSVDSVAQSPQSAYKDYHKQR